MSLPSSSPGCPQLGTLGWALLPLGPPPCCLSPSIPGVGSAGTPGAAAERQQQRRSRLSLPSWANTARSPNLPEPCHTRDTLHRKFLPHVALALWKRCELIPASAGAPSGNSAVFGFWDERHCSFTLMEMGLHYTAYITGCHAGASGDVDCAHLHKSKNK